MTPKCSAASFPPSLLVFQRGLPTMTYTAGDIISFNVDITAHHKGRLSFSICPDAEVTEACFAAHPLFRWEVTS